tara:strand:+ start:5293 stop:5466 length:174 start_codon:yes stop_codon:yes gene_type:complete
MKEKNHVVIETYEIMIEDYQKNLGKITDYNIEITKDMIDILKTRLLHLRVRRIPCSL